MGCTDENLRCLMGIKRMDNPGSRIRQLYVATKSMDKKTDDGSAMWREWRKTGLLKGSM